MDYSKLEEHNDTDAAEADGHLLDDDVRDDHDGLSVDTVSDLSALDKLRKAVERKERVTSVYPVPEGTFPELGSSLEFEFSTQITTNELNRYQAASRPKGRKSDVDAGKASALVLAEKSVAIYIDGKKLVDDEGEAMTLRSQEILDLTGSRTAADGVRRLLGDGTTTSMSDSLVEDAGFGDSFSSTGNPTSRA